MSEWTNKSISFLLHELNEWVGSEITITKFERNDEDIHTLQLKNVEIVNQLQDEDDYVDPHTVQLQGKGMVYQENGPAVQLPLDSYELPIHELVSIEASTEILTLKTDRATYTLTQARH